MSRVLQYVTIKIDQVITTVIPHMRSSTLNITYATGPAKINHVDACGFIELPAYFKFALSYRMAGIYDESSCKLYF